MSLDYGDKRTGVAISDPLQMISYPLCTIDRNNLIDEILKIINDKKIEKIVIGLPLSMSGNFSEQTKKVLEFKDLLEQNLLSNDINIIIDTIDERMSSISAKNEMIKQGIKTGHNKGMVDQLSASIMLQEYLDSN